MDLHDFMDVAENYDLYVEKLVSRNEPLGQDSCVRFHLELAEKYGSGGIVDIGCGTGLTLIPLLKEGYEVVGVDISISMIEVLKNKLNSLNLKPELICSNMSNFSNDSRFSLAIIPRSGFIHLITREEQKESLINIKNHLDNNGVLVLNTFYPNIEILYEYSKDKNNKFLRGIYTNKNGNNEKIYNEMQYNFETQISKGKWIFEELDENNRVISKRERPIAIRNTFKYEMENLIELCGFKIINVFGGYDKREASYPGNIIWVLMKND